jgi:phosphatidylglycerol:prolipoprotein diacylglycerol transferase
LWENVDGAPWASLLFARAGLSWYGGFTGGLGAGLLALTVKRPPVVPVLAAATPALALGHAIGRIGCLLVGDDYGRPTSLPWGIAFPQGAPPTEVRPGPAPDPQPAPWSSDGDQVGRLRSIGRLRKRSTAIFSFRQ